MHDAIARMLSKYECRVLNDYTNALREILQEVALLGLWRAKFFEKAAFYGGTALRVLYGLDRFSEDMDFSLLEPLDTFDLAGYTAFLRKETEAFGFDVRVEKVDKAVQTPSQSAFLKVNTRNQLVVIETQRQILQAVPKGQVLKIKLEVDTDPPNRAPEGEQAFGRAACACILSTWKMVEWCSLTDCHRSIGRDRVWPGDWRTCLLDAQGSRQLSSRDFDHPGACDRRLCLG